MIKITPLQRDLFKGSNGMTLNSMSRIIKPRMMLTTAPSRCSFSSCRTPARMTKIAPIKANNLAIIPNRVVDIEGFFSTVGIRNFICVKLMGFHLELS